MTTVSYSRIRSLPAFAPCFICRSANGTAHGLPDKLDILAANARNAVDGLDGCIQQDVFQQIALCVFLRHPESHKVGLIDDLVFTVQQHRNGDMTDISELATLDHADFFLVTDQLAVLVNPANRRFIDNFGLAGCQTQHVAVTHLRDLLDASIAPREPCATR